MAEPTERERWLRLCSAVTGVPPITACMNKNCRKLSPECSGAQFQIFGPSSDIASAIPAGCGQSLDFQSRSASRAPSLAKITPQVAKPDGPLIVDADSELDSPLRVERISGEVHSAAARWPRLGLDWYSPSGSWRRHRDGRSNASVASRFGTLLALEHTTARFINPAVA